MTSPKAGRGGRRSGSERLAATQSLREVKFKAKKNVRAQLCVPVTFNKAVWLSLGYDYEPSFNNIHLFSVHGLSINTYTFR